MIPIKVELKELTVNDSYDVYNMLKEIGLAENGFTNSFPLDNYQTFSKSLLHYVEEANGIGIEEGRVPQTIFWLYIDEYPVAFGKLRHRLNEELLQYGGHIGYMVRSSERGKGYGKLMLKELLKAARDKKIEKVLITCDETNHRSRRVIESNRGELEGITNGVCKYWRTIL
ncbi:GNAT family N-acetyltransferase [Paenibacillus sp. FSL W8-0186]|uniref:GNAT family N-acetyltransferase n=1 Tax=Paenibacillus sp. FSL W8-0186 TaxID=2921709 RepID=UPI0030D4FBF9